MPWYFCPIIHTIEVVQFRRLCVVADKFILYIRYESINLFTFRLYLACADVRCCWWPMFDFGSGAVI